MTTKLYLLPEPPGPPELDLPAGEHSTNLPLYAANVVDRAFRGSLGPADLTTELLGATSLALVANQEGYLAQFISPRVRAVNIPGANWNAELWGDESNADLNGVLRVAFYRIRAGGVTEIGGASGLVLNPELSALEIDAVTASNNPGVIALLDDDRLMVEVWFDALAAAASQRVVRLMIGANSFVEVPATVTFVDDGPRDFTAYDAYLDTLGVLYQADDSSHPPTQTLPLRPVRQDVGNNPFEIRPEYGDYFGQGDFSHGSGQRYFHREGRDPKKYLLSDGYDISDPGRLTHLHGVASDNGPGVGVTVLEVVGGLPFAGAEGSGNVRRGDGAFPGVWTVEDATVAHGSTVEDLTAAGDELFAVMANGHLHKRDAAGVWSHVTTLATNPGTKLAWVKDRLIVVGNLTVYEVAGGVARALETLAAGWTVQDIGENGEFVYVAATNANAGLSRIHHYGLDETGTIVKKGSSPMPRGQLAFSVRGYLDVLYVGAGKQNISGGYDPVVYQAFPAAGGNLKLLKVAEQEGSGATDLGVRDIFPLGESVLLGWSLGASAVPTGSGPRTGLAIHHLDRDAFAHHLQLPRGLLANPTRILSIALYKGRVLFLVAGQGLFYETVGTYVLEATLISSLADWSNAGLKTWDLVELQHTPLVRVVIGGNDYTPLVFLDYSTDEPENAAWIGATASSGEGSTGSGAVRILASSRSLAVRIRSLATPNGAVSPAITSFSVRSAPKPQTTEFVLMRVVRLLPEDRKDEEAEPVYLADVQATRAAIMDLAYTWVPFYEPDGTWLVHVEQVEAVEPEEPILSGTEGDAAAEGYVLKLTMVGTRTSP